VRNIIVTIIINYVFLLKKIYRLVFEESTTAKSALIV